MFNDERFASALAEMENPSLSDYEFFVECRDVKIYRHYDDASGLYEYKCVGHLSLNCDVMQEVYMDLEYRKSWDSYVKELRQVPSSNVIYWNVNFPFPLSNRDYTYLRECRRHDDVTWVILAEGTSTPDIPAKSSVVRVTEYKQLLVIRKVDDKKTKVFMHYFDNPGGAIPTWLINWAAKTGVPKFLDDMEKACAGYEKYLEKSKK